jgi:AraC family transcriptional regulator of arabinose operon
MSDPSTPSAAPVSSPIISGILPNENAENRAYRPDGTDDWLIVATRAGGASVRTPSGRLVSLGAGDLLLIQPGILHDYGYVEEKMAWRNIWVHFRPRAHWLDWLDWPMIDNGIAILSTGEGFAAIELELLRMVDVANGPSRLRIDAAMNALERVLILADHHNPRFVAQEMDDRIHRALEIVGEQLSEKIDIRSLSRSVGLSRSQFTALFTRQLKLTPQAYIENVRLSRAAQMLRSSNWSVGQVAAANGFSSPFYFSTRFRREFGISPSGYRYLHLSQEEAPGSSAARQCRDHRS